MTRRRKPAKPGSTKLLTRERAEHNAEIIRLERQGAVVNLDPRTQRMVSAYRSNVFTVLLKAQTIHQGHYNAAQTLIEDWAEWKGLDGKPGQGEFVDGGSGCPELITDRMIIAGKRVNRTLDQVGPMDRDLLSAFMVATVEEDRPMAWRGIVQKITAIDQRDRQSTLVVSALENLRRVMEAPMKRQVA